MKLHKLFILFFLALVITVFNTEEFHCQENPSVEDQTMTATLTDSVPDVDLTSFIPPPPGLNTIFITTNRYIFIEYKHWEYWATLTGSNYNQQPKTSFDGINWKVDDGNMVLAEYKGMIGWLFIPKAPKGGRLPRYNVENKVEVCFYLNSEMDAWLPGKDFVKMGKIDKKYLLDRDGDESFNYWIHPVELPIDADESTFDLNVSTAELDEYLRSAKK